MLVFDHYEIPRPSVWSDENDARWRQLAAALAIDNVPGLQITNPGGAPKRWGEQQCRKLYVDVMLYCHRNLRKSEREACHNLAITEPWCSFVRPDRAAHTLYRKLKEIERQQPRLVDLVEKIKRRWPDDIENKLKFLSEPYNF